MTTIYAIDTDTIHETEFIVNGQDVLADIMGNNGATHDYGHDCDFAMTEEDALWWIRWVKREERIIEACGGVTDEQKSAMAEAVDIYSADMEAMQDAEERILGIID